MSQLSIGPIYILILTAIAAYYFVKFYIIKWAYPLIRFSIQVPVLLPYECIRDFIKYCKK